MDRIIYFRNKVNGLLYENFIKRICFKFDAEKVHNFFIRTGNFLGRSKVMGGVVSVSFDYSNEFLEQDILGIHFRNPVGLSAGFDKNAELVDILKEVGFGFAEVGSISAKACEGNKGKRLDRISEGRSLWVNLGLNNDGAVKISNRLKGREFDIPLGISIAKTNCKESVNVKKGIKDYVDSLIRFKDIGNYIDLNISCPNSYGGQPFSKPRLYEMLLKEVAKLKIRKPIFVKLSPDLDKKSIDRILDISYKHRISGFVCSNLTKKHGLGKGGLSGKFVEELANELLEYIYRKTKGDFVLIGVGGIFSAEDAYKKIKLGASLVELITGMVYKGPSVISEINYGLVKLLERDDFKNIREAVGVDVR